MGSPHPRQAGRCGPGGRAPTLAPASPGGGGEPLPADALGFFEPRFGHDLSRIRIHADDAADASSRRLGALAFTLGSDLYFARNQYAPGSVAGRRLLAHELAHAVLERGRGTIPRRQQVPPGGGAGGGGLTGLDRSNPENFRLLLAALDAVGAVARGGTATLTVGSRSQALGGEAIARLRAAATDALSRGFRQSRGQAEMALSGYESQLAVNAEFPIVSRIVTTFGRIRDPGPELRPLVQRALQAVASGIAALQAGRLKAASDALDSAERAARRAASLSSGYRHGIIDSGERQVEVLRFTRDASFITLGVLAIVATGGAAAAAAAGAEGAAAAGAGVTAFGVNLGASTATVTTVIATGAPIVATVSEAGARAALGDHVDWGQVGIEVMVSLVMARFGGRLANGLFARLGGNAAIQSMGRVAFTRALASVATHEGAIAFRAAVEGVYGLLRGRRITWGQFISSLIDRLADPRGMIIAAVMGAAVGAVESRAARTTPAGESPAPTQTTRTQREAPPREPQTTRRGTEPAPTRSAEATSQRGPASSATTAAATSEAALGRELARAVEAALERPVQPATRQAVDTALARLRPLLDRLAAARRNPGSLTQQERQALAQAQEEIDRLRLGPSGTIRRGGEGSTAETAWRNGADQVRRWADAGEELTLDRIIALNRILRQGEPNASTGPGGLSTIERSAGGDVRRSYVSPGELGPAMSRFLAWYNTARHQLNPVELAARAYQRLVSIHPFDDANGRTTRLVMDWIMRAHGLPEAPLPQGQHTVAVFGMMERFNPGSGVPPDTAVRSLMVGLWDTLARLPESIRGPMPPGGHGL